MVGIGYWGAATGNHLEVLDANDDVVMMIYSAPLINCALTRSKSAHSRAGDQGYR
jgi:hypothetical protein